jgi:hypothetical protein
MEDGKWTRVLMLCGFGVAAISLALLLFARLSSSATVIATILESIGIGVGSIGLGGHITKNKQRK